MARETDLIISLLAQKGRRPEELTDAEITALSVEADMDPDFTRQILNAIIKSSRDQPH
jgi:hypothetical protein